MAARAGTGTSRVSTAKISIGSGGGGGTGGKALTTPSFNFNEGGLTRSNTEFLNESRRTLADLRANRAGYVSLEAVEIHETKASRVGNVDGSR